MPRTRVRALSLAIASVLLSSTVLATPAAAAEDPASSVAALLEAVAGRRLEDLDGLVCEPQQQHMRELFSEALPGVDLMAESVGPVGLVIEDLQIELLESDAERAKAWVTGRLAVDIADAGLRDFVRELIEVSEAGSGLPVTEADIDETLPLLEGMPGLERPLADAVTLARVDDEWVVCGGFENAASDAAGLFGVGPLASTEGLCALATPAEVSQLGPLRYDSSTGFDVFCTYSHSDWQAYHAATVSLLPDTTLDDWRTAYPPEADLGIGGATGFSSGASVLTEAGTDVLLVTVSLPDASVKVEAATQAAAISALFLPRLDELALDPVAAAAAGPSLCDRLTIGRLNDVSERAFDAAEGDAGYCIWTSLGPATGLDTVMATVTELTLEEFRELVGGTVEGEIEGRPVISTPTQAVVELPDGRTLDVSVHYDEHTEPTVPAYRLALSVVELLAPEVAPAED